MTSEEQLKAALVAYRSATVAASEAAQAALLSLREDVLASTLQPFQVLQQAAYSSVDKNALDAAIKALEDRAAALAKTG